MLAIQQLRRLPRLGGLMGKSNLGSMVFQSLQLYCQKELARVSWRCQLNLAGRTAKSIVFASISWLSWVTDKANPASFPNILSFHRALQRTRVKESWDVQKKIDFPSNLLPLSLYLCNAKQTHCKTIENNQNQTKPHQNQPKAMRNQANPIRNQSKAMQNQAKTNPCPAKAMQNQTKHCQTQHKQSKTKQTACRPKQKTMRRHQQIMRSQTKPIQNNANKIQCKTKQKQ